MTILTLAIGFHNSKSALANIDKLDELEAQYTLAAMTQLIHGVMHGIEVGIKNGSVKAEHITTDTLLRSMGLAALEDD